MSPARCHLPWHPRGQRLCLLTGSEMSLCPAVSGVDPPPALPCAAPELQPSSGGSEQELPG